MRGPNRLTTLVLVGVTAIALSALAPQTGVGGLNTRRAEAAIAGAQDVVTDITAYASDFGVPFSIAAENLNLQELSGAIAETVATEFPDDWVGHFVTHGEAFAVRFLVTSGAAADRLGRLILEHPVLSRVATTEHRSLSLVELERNASAILATSPLARSFDIDIDIDAGRIHIQTTAAAIGSALDAIDAAGPLSSEVVLEVVQALSQPNVDIYGGLHLSPVCTSGFSVQNAAGNRGIVFAGHCPDVSYAGVSLSTISTAFGGSSDLKWARAVGHTYPNWAYDAYTPPYYRRDIASTKSRAATGIGDFVCHYGRGSAYGCGQVVSKTKAPGYIPDVTATYIEVQDDTSPYIDLSVGSDSGGPWFYGNAAYGIHSGGAGPNPHEKTNGIYTSVSYIGNLGNVSISTTP